MLKHLVLGVASLALPLAAAAAPEFDTFGPLPQATFGGSGIPNNAVAISRYQTGNTTFTLGLAAHERFVGPLANDGAGTYFAQPGLVGGAATWNFNWYVNAAPSVPNDVVPPSTSVYGWRLYYDIDPSAAIQYGALQNPLFGITPPLATNEASQNLTFGFLYTAVPGAVSPPAGTFNANTPGLYTFELVLFRTDSSVTLAGISSNEVLLDRVKIDVRVVPEPGALALLGALLLPFGFAAARRGGRRNT